MRKLKTGPELWVSWHCSRRSRSISRLLGLELCEIQYEGGIITRHARSMIWTLALLLRRKPRVVFLQYSFLLMLVLAIYKKLSVRQVMLISDCHTKALRRKLHGRLAGIFLLLKKWSLSMADLIVISNKGQYQEASAYNEKVFVLSDPIPAMTVESSHSRTRPNCVFVMSYAEDEPIEEIFSAAETVSRNLAVYITGKIPGTYQQQISRIKGVHFTDYLPDADYNRLLAGADCVVALTTENDCLQCAGYEALAVGVPLVTNQSDASCQYFGDAVIYVDNEATSIVSGIENAIRHAETLRQRMGLLLQQRQDEIVEKIGQLQCIYLTTQTGST